MKYDKNKNLFLSDYLKLGRELKEKGVFDQILNLDNQFYINIQKLKEAKTKEFLDSHEKINRYFEDIIKMIDVSNSINDRLGKEVIKKLTFKEVDELKLGVSRKSSGKGVGPKIAQKIAIDSYQIVKAGIKNPEIFHLIGLFTVGMGADRLSDIITNIILEDIKSYTKRIMKELGINKVNYPKLSFESDYLINPFDSAKIYMIPKELLDKIPIAKDWGDVDYVVRENSLIRDAMNDAVLNAWKEYTVQDKKDHMMNNFIENYRELIVSYKNTLASDFDVLDDVRYSLMKFIQQEKPQISIDETITDSFQFGMSTLLAFKDYLENKEGNKLVHHKNIKQISEELLQILYITTVENIKSIYDYDISPETSTGRGNVDFKISRGENDKTIIEFKMSNNINLKHALNVQLNEYGKAENTDNKILVIFDLMISASKTAQIQKFIKEQSDSTIILVSLEKKESASVYKKTKE